jgi:hypothetical protein
MDERKEQRELETVLPQSKGALALLDEVYSSLGAVLSSRDAKVRTASGDEVVGFPAPSMTRETLSLSWSIFGRLPKSIMLALDLERLLAPLVIRNLVPRCTICGSIAHKSSALSSFAIPENGFVAFVIRDGAQDLSLEERCELLGVERAYVEGKIVRVDDISDRDGEPVLRLFPAARLSEQREVVDEWFARGGGVLAVVYLASRESQGSELGTVSGGWRCSTCELKVAPPSMADLYDPVACARCRGEGWLSVEHGRLMACEECDGFGSTASITQAQLGPVMLRNGAALTIADLLAGDFELSPEESQLLRELCSAGLGRYPLGTPLALLSSSEKIRLAIVSTRLSAVRGLTCVVDAPAVGVMAGSPEREAWIHSIDSSIVLFEPEYYAIPRRLLEGSGSGCIEIRDLCVGSVSADRMSFPIGRASLVQAATGAPIVHLFDEIERRFSQRRKYSQLCNFGALKRCERLDCRQVASRSVLEMLGLERKLAEGLARSQTARQSGFSVDDLDLAKGTFRCRVCSDGDREATSDACPACRGALYDWRVSSLPIGASSLGQVMQSDLEQARKALWSNDVIDAVLSRIPEGLKKRLSLATSPATLAPAERRFLVGCGALAHTLSQKVRRAKKSASDPAATLMLIEGVFATTGLYQEILLDLIDEALGAGATVVCSEAPQALESCFSSVVRLVDCEVRPTERVQSRFLDRRLSRWSKVG